MSRGLPSPVMNRAKNRNRMRILVIEVSCRARGERERNVRRQAQDRKFLPVLLKIAKKICKTGPKHDGPVSFATFHF